MTHQDYSEHRVLLLLCDISGYTRFMVANAKTRSHSYAVMTELMQALLRQVEAPIEIAKLEGDAIFLYARWPEAELAEADLARRALLLLDGLFAGFEEKQRELAASNLCPCDACKNIDRLTLKVVVHSGRAAMHSIGRFCEVSGVDVILAHRLLKNSLRMDRYVLLTEAAWQALRPHETAVCRHCEEEYEEIGTVSARVALPPLAPASLIVPLPPRRYYTPGWKAFHILKRIVLSRLIRLGWISRRKYKNPA